MMMLLFVSMIIIANAPTAVSATDNEYYIPTDTLYRYKTWGSSDVSTLSSFIGNTINDSSQQRVEAKPITWYGLELTNIPFRLMLPPQNFSVCTTVGNYNYSGNYNASTVLRSNNNITTGLLFYDIQVDGGLNCSFNEIIYNAYKMFEESQIYLLFPNQYIKQFQNEINVATYPLQHHYVLPTILFLPNYKMKTLATELKGDADVDGESSYDTYYVDYVKYVDYVPPTLYDTNQNTESKSDSSMNGAFAGGIIAAFLLFCVCLVNMQDRNSKKTSSTSQVSNDSHVELTASSHQPPSGGETLQQQQNIMNSVSLSAQQDNKEIDLVTYESFQALPRIHYNKSYTYSKRREFNKVTVNTEEEIYLCQTGTNTIDHTGKGPVIVASADDVVVTECPNDNEIHTLNSVSTHQLVGCSNRTMSGMGNDNNNNNNNNEICAICVDEFQNREMIIQLPRCQHMYHIKCLGLWLLEQKSNFCPLCKLEVFENNNIIINNNERNLEQQPMTAGLISENTPITLLLPEYSRCHVVVPMGIYDDNIINEPVVVPSDNIIGTVPNMTNEHNNNNDTSFAHHDRFAM